MGKHQAIRDRQSRKGVGDLIDSSSFARDWIISIRGRSFPKADPGIIEKFIVALALLERLALTDLDFVFKGGTSLHLLLPEFNRFSTDIDIVVRDEAPNIDKALPEFAREYPFVRYSADERNNRGIPKSHFKFFYRSEVYRREEYVLLDVLYEQHGYPILQEKEVKHHAVRMEPDSQAQVVNIPDADGLIGDKLTAFAPNTTGISRFNSDGSGRELDILKQLFDIGRLFDYTKSIETVREAFKRISAIEAGYRKKNLSDADVIHDVFETSLMIGSRGASSWEEFYLALLAGCRKLSGYVYNGRFVENDMILAASKAAYLSALLKSSTVGPIVDLVVDDSLLESYRFSKINKLRKTNLQAFRYFKQAIIAWETIN